MKTYFLELFTLIPLLIGCSNANLNHNSKDSTISKTDMIITKVDTIAFVTEIDRKCREVDNEKNLKLITNSFPLVNYRGDSFQIQLFSDSKVAKKIIVRINNSSDTSEILYFINKYVVEVFPLVGYKIVDVYLGDHTGIRYEKEMNRIKIRLKLEYSDEAKLSKKLSDFMQFFQALSFQNIKPSVKAGPSIWTIKPISMKERPNKNSKNVLNLKKHSELIYLGSSEKRDTVENNIWIWYKVSTLDNKTGWIFGHPKYVDLINEND